MWLQMLCQGRITVAGLVLQEVEEIATEVPERLLQLLGEKEPSWGEKEPSWHRESKESHLWLLRPHNRPHHGRPIPVWSNPHHHSK